MTLLDTNMLLRSAKTDDPLCETADKAILSRRSIDDVLCIVPQNLYEFWATATRPVEANGLGMSITEAQTEVARLKKIFQVLKDSEELLPEWETLVIDYSCRGRVSFDARLVAAMKIYQIPNILTFNVQDFRRFPGINVLDAKIIGSANTSS
jgi:predicted nucleic acid-binding protein